MIIDTMELNSEEIDILLKDISDYLKRRKENTTLSTDDRKMVEILIERSKKELQKIAVLKSKEEDACYDVIDAKSEYSANKEQQNSKTEDERYVDMSKKSPLESPPPLPLKKVESQPRKASPETTRCPFSDLPAREVSHEIKHGTLLIRRKVFSIIDRCSKVFGAVHENWLLMYWSSKDSKPFCALDLKHYEAKEDESDPTLTELDITKDGSLKKNSVKMASSFKVFQSAFPEKKCYNFVATTHKDMLQWVVNINRSHDKAVRAGKDIDEQVYDICEEPPSDAEEENIYNEIDFKPASKPPAPLPKNQERTAESEVFTVIKPPSTSESTEEIYQVLADTTDKKSSSSMNSFEFSEEDEEDQTYYELATVREEVKELELKVQHAEKFNYDIPPPLQTMEMNASDDKENYENSLLLTPSRLPEVTETSVEASKEKLDIKLEGSQIPKNNGNDIKAELSVKVTSSNDKLNKILQNGNWVHSSNDQKHSTSNEDYSNRTNKNHFLQKKGTPNTDIHTNNNPGSVKRKDYNEKNVASKPNQTSSIVKIIRQRFSTIESQSRSLETFSRNSKLETFQASPTKDGVLTDFDFLNSPNSDIDESLKPIDSLESKRAELKSNKKKADDEKPMVLLKADLDEEESSKKLKKSPVANKPKKGARKLQL